MFIPDVEKHNLKVTEVTKYCDVNAKRVEVFSAVYNVLHTESFRQIS